MNWDSVQAFGELIAAVGVLISLVYLAAQVRQSADRTHAEIIQQYTSGVNALRETLWSSDDGINIWMMALAGTPIEDRATSTRVRLFWASAYKAMEAGFLQHQAGHIPTRVWTTYAREWLLSFDSPGGRAAFAALDGSRFFDPDFAAFVTQRLADPEIPNMGELRARWDQLLEAQA